jgi:hypothetical protein
MQTLQERLTAYCSANNKEKPFGRHLDAISFSIVNKIKEVGKYESVKKKKEIISVNNYPTSLIPIVDSIIEEYFINTNLFIRKTTPPKDKKTKRFNYDIPDYKAPAFEEALKKCEMEVKVNKKSHGKAQYCIEVVSWSGLINLGKAFQKERFFQEKRERQQKFQAKQ